MGVGENVSQCWVCFLERELQQAAVAMDQIRVCLCVFNSCSTGLLSDQTAASFPHTGKKTQCQFHFEEQPTGEHGLPPRHCSDQIHIFPLLNFRLACFKATNPNGFLHVSSVHNLIWVAKCCAATHVSLCGEATLLISNASKMSLDEIFFIT